MSDSDSDESWTDNENGQSTNVLLGYASQTATDDAVSQLGGHPSWLSSDSTPSASLAKCKTCNKFMSLLLQLNGDLPDRFPGHERRLYVWACRNRPCKRQLGSIRAFRETRISQQAPTLVQDVTTPAAVESKGTSTGPASAPRPAMDYGAAIFGTVPANGASSGSNLFATTSSKYINPFSTAPAPLSSLAAKPPQKPASDPSIADLPATFADKARISSSTPSNFPSNASPAGPQEPWPSQESFPKPYPQYYLDADYEYLSNDAAPTPPSAQHSAFMDVDGPDGPSSGTGQDNEKDVYESPHDTTFQHFADCLAQNPEQVLRYEFDGVPLLYSKTDATGKLFAAHSSQSHKTTSKVTTTSAPGGSAAASVPRCTTCGSRRAFELQLTPHAIVELEAELDVAQALSEGMEWGTVIVAVCAADCVPQGTATGASGFVEEWVGVQWEELVKRQ